jgi:amino acid adenylation domain-containing protein/non-ribosomal peptide synthase protein (TIGR01720 family)
MIAELFTRLKELKVNIQVDGDRLDLQAPKGVLNKSLLEEISACKQELIAFIQANKKTGNGSLLIPATAVETSYPISAAQRRLWILSQSEEASIAYNMSGVYEFKGLLDQTALKRACKEVINRHESLRTVFRPDEQGNVRQFILSAAEALHEITCEDLRDQKDPGLVLRERLQQNLDKPFWLDKALIRVCLYRLTNHRWVFGYVIHHIISDGWSMNVLIAEITRIYNAYTHGADNPLQPLRVQYRDYVAWQNEQLSGAALDRHKTWWLQQFSGNLPVLQLPADKVRPAVKTYGGAFYSTKMDVVLVIRLKDLCRKLGGTLFTGLLAAFNALCYRYTNLEDIIIGSPVAGRPHIDLEDQIGFYANTLALRTQFTGRNNFRELFQRVKEVVAGAYEHQVYPFDQLVEELKLHRDISRNPLFDVQVILQNAETRDAAAMQGLNNLQVKSYSDSTRLISVFDMVLNFVETGDTLDARVVYNPDIYSGNNMVQMVGHLERLVAAIVDDPDMEIGQLEYLDDAEKNQLLTTFNDTAIGYDARNVIDLFRDQAQALPDHHAVVCGNMQLTYRELDRRSDQLAAYLRSSCNIGKEEMIGVMLDRSENLVIAVMGILKAGGVYVPIDPNYPKTRKAFIVQDTGIKILLTLTDYIFDLEYFSGSVVAVDLQGDEFERADPVPAALIDRRQLAYVIYTSGSTGQPKGVMIDHFALSNSIQAQKTVFNIRQRERLLQFFSLSFDVSVFEIMVSLIAGATLYIIKEEDKKDPVLLEEYILRNSIDTATLPAAYLSQLQMDRLATLEKLIIGGETPGLDKVADFVQHGGTCFNAYGPTESAICVTALRINNETPLPKNNLPIGVPVPNTRIYVLDDRSRLLPIGAAGEICIGGANVGSGYLNNIELTAARFVADPFNPGQRMYRTGDVGKWQPDGNLVFLGRRDEQVKIRGYRIELGEIEAVLQSHEDVDGAVIIARRDEGGEQELIAYITGSNAVSLAALRGWLTDQLPAYMIPAHFEQLEKWPLTPNGKIDKKKLPEVGRSGLATGKAYVVPRNEQERAVAEVFEEVLKKKQVSIKEDFFVLGGDSIKAIQVVSRLKQRNYSVNLQDVLLHPVVEELSERITVIKRSIPQELVEGEIPLGPIQRLFFSNACNVKHHYNQSVLLQGHGHLSIAGLLAALKQIVLHHDALRMVYRYNEAGWVQENLGREQGFGWQVVEDMTDDAVFLSHCEQVQNSFNLGEGPLLKVCLFTGTDNDRLLLVAHHLVMDGVSWRILLEDLAVLYDLYEQGLPLGLPLKTDSYKYWQQQQLIYSNSTVFQQEASYWSMVTAQPVNRLPVDDAEGGNLVKDTASCWFMLEEDVSQRLFTQCYKAWQTEINDILVTALGLGVSEVFGVEKISIQLEGHGREDIGAETDTTRTIGWFTTVYPVVLDLQYRSDRIRQLIAVKEHLHRVPNKGIGYGILCYLKGEVYDLEPQINFNYLGDFGDGRSNGEAPWSFSEETHGPRITGEWHRSQLLDVTGIVVSGRLGISLSYSNKQYKPSTMERLSAAFRKHLEALIAILSGIAKPGLTPVDLTYKELTVDQLLDLNRDGLIEDIYPLSPLQEGMYYQWLLSPKAGTYFEQISYQVIGDPDIGLLEKSYAILVSRHGALRTGFVEHVGQRPLQVVRQKVENNFYYEEVSGNPDFSLDSFRSSDRSKGFDLHGNSQMRLHVLGRGQGAYEFIWSHHHVVMDGWCVSILIRDFFEIYQCLSGGEAVPEKKVYPYSDYIKWLEKQDRELSLLYWRDYLSGYDKVSGLPVKTAGGLQAFIPRTMVFSMEGSVRESVRELCSELSITESTFVQVAWGIVLSRYNNTGDVVFGAVVSGRPPELKGVEEMIGLFINTIPVRIQAPDTAIIQQLLKEVHQTYINGVGHHYTQLADIQSHSLLKQGLFDHALTFENYPVLHSLEQREKEKMNISAAALSDVFDVNNYDFGLVVVPGSALLFKFVYNENLYDNQLMGQVRDRFIRVIEQMAAAPALTIGQIDHLSHAEKLALEKEYTGRSAGFSTALSDDF